MALLIATPFTSGGCGSSAWLRSELLYAGEEVQVSPPAARIPVGQRQAFRAVTVRDASVVTGRVFTWRSTDASVAEVVATPDPKVVEAMGLRPGETQIIARDTKSAITGRATLTVEPAEGA